MRRTCYSHLTDRELLHYIATVTPVTGNALDDICQYPELVEELSARLEQRLGEPSAHVPKGVRDYFENAWNGPSRERKQEKNP